MPEISIVLLTRAGLPLLEQTLHAICAQKVQHPFEVIAVDSGSPDATLQMLRDFGVRLYQIPPHEFNFGRAREWGYELAQGEYIVTLSQDSLPVNACWLARLIAPFEESTVAAVQGGGLLPPRPARLFYWERLGRFYFTRESQRWLAKYHFGFSNTNSAVRQPVWSENRLGPIEMCEDKLLQKEWTARGLKLAFAPEAAVYHAHYYDLASLTRRCENEGLGHRLIGERYSLLDCLGDMLNLENWALVAKAWARGERLTRAEMFFPLVRPFFLWKGYRWTQHYVRGAEATKDEWTS